MDKIRVEKTGNPGSVVGSIGSVRDVIAARLSPKITSRRLKASDYQFGFELGTPRGLESLGELVVVNGNAYTLSTDVNSPDYHKTIHGPEFTAGALFLIPPEAKPSHRAHFQGTTPLPLIECYKQVYQEIKQPFGFAGLIECTELHGFGLGIPPQPGKTIFENKELYFPNPPVKKTNLQAFVIGAMTDDRDPRLSSLNQTLDVVLYRNPLDKDEPLLYHAHTLTLKKKVSKPQEISPSIVDLTLHLFCEGTKVRTLQWDIFTIKELRQF